MWGWEPLKQVVPQLKERQFRQVSQEVREGPAGLVVPQLEVPKLDQIPQSRQFITVYPQLEHAAHIAWRSGDRA